MARWVASASASTERVRAWKCGLGVAGGEGLGYDDVDGSAVFGVDEDEGAEGGGLLHDLEHEAVVDHEDVGVGHEELEGGDAAGDHLPSISARVSLWGPRSVMAMWRL